MIYVISKDGKPLMPCSNPIARLLLKQGKAKVKKREPYQMWNYHEEYLSKQYWKHKIFWSDG